MVIFPSVVSTFTRGYGRIFAEFPYSFYSFAGEISTKIGSSLSPVVGIGLAAT